MRKSEIKSGVKIILESINNFREELDEVLQPIEEITKHLESIQNIQDEHGLDCGIDFEEVERDLIINLIEDNSDFEEINNSFDYLITDLENWMEDVSERKQEQIQEEYIDVLEELRTNIDTSGVYDKDSLDDMLIGLINSIEESGLI